MSKAYYNEIDANAAQWLRNLIVAGLIAPGDVDERSIEDVSPDDLVGYTQCHFFAGIGVWSYALRLAGWSDSEPVWTGSCPCQPFSTAGKQKALGDNRHLWPAWFRLIRQRKPPVVFGEQVEAAIRHGWLDLVQSDLEGEGYALGKAVLGACSVGAPHIRQRLWFVADSEFGSTERYGFALGDSQAGMPGGTQEWQRVRVDAGNGDPTYLLGNSVLPRLQGLSGDDDKGDEPGRIDANAARPAPEAVIPGGVAFPYGWNARSERVQRSREHGQQPSDGGVGPGRRPGPTNSFWRDADWLLCRDGKWRPVEAGTFTLAHGITGRVGKLRAFGNAISPWVAKEFIESYTEVRKMDKGE